MHVGRLVRVLIVAPALVLAALAFGTSSGAGEQSNLLANGQFDVGIEGWVSNGADLAWDASPSPGTEGGVMVATNNLTYDYRNAAYGVQCLTDIRPSGWYIVRARVFVPSGQPRFFDAGVNVQGFGDEQCSSPGSQGGPDTGTTVTDEWVELSGFGQFTAAARSAKVYLFVQKDPPPPGEDDAGVSARFDNVFFAQAYMLVTPLVSRE